MKYNSEISKISVDTTLELDNGGHLSDQDLDYLSGRRLKRFLGEKEDDPDYLHGLLKNFSIPNDYE